MFVYQRPLIIAIACLCAGFSTAQGPVAEEWLFDEVILTNGAKFKGIVLEETRDGTRFRIVSRQKGRPTVTMTTLFTKAEIASTKKLPEPDRQKLHARLAELDPSGQSERMRMDSLELIVIPWAGKEGAGRKYISDYFQLETGATDEIARRAAVKLELLSTAFRRFLPPRVAGGKPVTIILAPDGAQAQAQRPGNASTLLNPAIYDPATNRIVCASELGRLGIELTATRLHHQRQFADIEKYENDVKKLYKGQRVELDRYLELARTQKQKVIAAEGANDVAFDQATARLFAVLYHEAFHAYVGTFVFPPMEGGKHEGLPRWLNEGLAQLFESAIVEAGELRILAPDAARLTKAIQVLNSGPNAVEQIQAILRSKPESFLATHAEQKAATDRAYLISWAMAHHLLLGKQCLPGERFLQYLKLDVIQSDPVSRFEVWVKSPVTEYSKELDQYLRQLKTEAKTK